MISSLVELDKVVDRRVHAFAAAGQKKREGDKVEFVLAHRLGHALTRYLSIEGPSPAELRERGRESVAKAIAGGGKQRPYSLTRTIQPLA
jgi:hypothetical protein